MLVVLAASAGLPVRLLLLPNRLPFGLGGKLLLRVWRAAADRLS